MKKIFTISFNVEPNNLNHLVYVEAIDVIEACNLGLKITKSEGFNFNLSDIHLVNLITRPVDLVKAILTLQNIDKVSKN